MNPQDLEKANSVSVHNEPDPESRPESDTEKTDNMMKDLGDGDLGGSIDVIKRKNGVSFRISNDVLFSSGKSELADKGLVELGKLVPFLLRTDYKVTVAGHTDDVPIQTDKFPSNWELSSARAGSVVRFFQAQGIQPDRLVARGHADTNPLVDNSTPENRAKNRRVELVLEDVSDTSAD